MEKQLQCSDTYITTVVNSVTIELVAEAPAVFELGVSEPLFGGVPAYTDATVNTSVRRRFIIVF